MSEHEQYRMQSSYSYLKCNNFLDHQFVTKESLVLGNSKCLESKPSLSRTSIYIAYL